MKSTENFKKVINAHLQSVAVNDSLFSETLKKPNKNINDCINYILNTVQKSGCNGFADDEIFGMAIHYYDEDSIEASKPITAKVVVNHSLPPTKNEVKKTKQEPQTKKEAPRKFQQISLFD